MFSDFSSSSFQAGPSNYGERIIDLSYPDLEPNSAAAVVDEDEENEQPTPRLPSASKELPPDETPAARLRAVLARTGSKPGPTAPSPPPPQSPSELESDFEVSTATASVAKESLRDLFSHALRDPGDTPQKAAARRRRNSIDLSEVESSPRVGRVEAERARNKGKRKVLSDDEVDSSNKSQRSGMSQAETFDMLRQRLSNSQSLSKHQLSSTSLYPESTTTPDDSRDSDAFLRNPNPSSPATPPIATSTPQQSLHLSTNSQFQFQSNLLEHDSEMEHAMDGLESYDLDSSEPKTPNMRSKSPGRSLQPSQDRNTHSPTGPSRADSHHGDTQNTIRLKDRYPENPTTSEPSRQYSRHPSSSRISFSKPGTSSTNGHASGLHRRSSMASLSSSNGSASRPSSRSSQAESVSDGLKDVETERNREREREWNRPRSSLSRQDSDRSLHSLAQGERPRKVSQPQRPGSSFSFQSPGHAHQRAYSSRGSSPSSASIHSHEEDKEIEEEVKAEVDHERERNWNAPRPAWHKRNSSFHRSISPLPPSPSSSTSSSLGVSPTNVRVRTQSLRPAGTPKGETPVYVKRNESRSSLSTSSSDARGTSPLPRKNTTLRSTQPSFYRPLSYPSRPRSPLPPTPKESSSLAASLRFPGTASPTQPGESDPEASFPGHRRVPSSPSPSPGSRYSRTSLIPVLSPSKRAKWHSTPSTSFASTRTSTLQVPGSSANGTVTGTDSDADPGESTPTLTTVTTPIDVPELIIPPTSLTTSTSILPRHHDETSPQGIVTRSLSPPSSSPSEESTPQQPTASLFPLLSTPPRRSSFSTGRVEFQTPSPPKGLPELPGPPSSDDDDDTRQHFGPNLTSMKTPKPPGAWAQTPAPERQTAMARSHSLDESSQDSGFVTPAASLSSVSTLPVQTPAPPGGWMSTPFAKKNVRFDANGVESEQSASEAVDESKDNSMVTDPSSRPNQSSRGDEISDVFPSVNGNPPLRPSTPDSSPRPLPPSLRSPRKSPGVRVVDEFGRECVPTPLAKPPKNDTPRNKSTVRIVDAMGMAVPAFSGTEESEQPLSRTEAFNRVRQGLSDLAKGLHDVELATVDLDQQRIKELVEVSNTARENRARLHRAELDLSSRLGPLRAGTMKSRAVANTVDRRSILPRLGSWTFWLLLVFQAILALIMYRMSTVRARRLFLTTYYDPFNPDLHLYLTKATGYRPPWSSLLYETLPREGFISFVGNVFNNIAAHLSDWRRNAWEVWGMNDPQVPSWPPT